MGKSVPNLASPLDNVEDCGKDLELLAVVSKFRFGNAIECLLLQACAGQHGIHGGGDRFIRVYETKKQSLKVLFDSGV